MDQETIDERLLTAAYERFEAARTLHHAMCKSKDAREGYEKAYAAHQAAVERYNNLERDVVAVVRERRQVAS